MDASEMTADELMELALAKRAEGPEGEPEPGPAPTARRVVVDGIAVEVDMRRMTDIRTVRRLQRAQRLGDELGGPVVLEVFDDILGDQVDRVTDALSDEDGYCPAERYSRFVARVMREAGGKN